MKKAVNIIFIVLFFGFCAVPLIGMLLGHKNVNAEKRALAAAPAVFTKDGFNAGFTREFDDYFTDNFAFRTNLVTMYAGLNAALLGESVSDQVIIGKDGWLFFEPTLNDYMKINTLSRNDIYRLAKTLEIQSRWLGERGIPFIFTAAPNKASIYGQHMPDRFKPLGETGNVEMLYAALKDFTNVEVVCCTPAIDEPRGGGAQLYHKLDTHWNNTGALLAYKELLGSIKELVPDFDFDAYEGLTPVIQKTWQGDLSAMLYPAAGILDEQADYGIAKDYSTQRPMKSLEDILIKTQSESGRLNLLMFRDSFANALIPIMSSEFESVTYSRAVPYDYSLLSEDTDVVIMEIAERNIPNLLKKAPLMPAPAAEISEAISPSDMRITMTTKDMWDYIKITGIALTPGYSADNDYDIYVRLSLNGQEYTFEPFPVLEEDYLDEYAGNENAAFCMLIQKDALPPGEYKTEVIVSHGGQYLSCEADSCVSHHR